jgi:hypothetical protein
MHKLMTAFFVVTVTIMNYDYRIGDNRYYLIENVFYHHCRADRGFGFCKDYLRGKRVRHFFLFNFHSHVQRMV